MLDAAERAAVPDPHPDGGHYYPFEKNTVKYAYRAMLAAAPKEKS
jgi:hypothetical protein